MGVLVIVLGFAVLFQFIILRIKWNRGDYADVGVDVVMLALLNAVFGGSILGVISVTAGSTLISLYLIWYPIKLFKAKTGDSDPNLSQTEQVINEMTEKFDRLFN